MKTYRAVSLFAGAFLAAFSVGKDKVTLLAQNRPPASQEAEQSPATAPLPNEAQVAPEAQAAPQTALPEKPAKAKSSEPDNTRVNKRDKNPGEVTADQQKMNPADRTLTAAIRKSVMADKGLSTYAHNVKIISQNGIVTLKGPVRSSDEVNSIVGKAVEAAGSADKVVNQLSVKP